MNRRRGKGTSSPVPIILMIAFALAVLVGIAILIAADPEEAPPPSTIAYEERPAERRQSDPMTLRRRSPGSGDSGPAPVVDDRGTPELEFASAELAEEAQAADYAISGTITDGRTGAPVGGVRLLASRVPTDAEASAFREKDQLLIETGETEAYAAHLDEKQRLWADAGASADADGRFRIPIVHAGDYMVTVLPQQHVRKTIEKSFVGESRPEWQLDIALETGATISGRVTDSLDNRGIEGIGVNATNEEERHLKQAVTDADGNYTIAGLSPGGYSVVADIEHTAYRVTRVLPYRRTSISAPDQRIENIDFQLDKGGVVWGYVTTPDNEPVESQVILCTSESVLTQALTALVRQAPPLQDSASKEDGYYELVGVPLNEEWRLYASADHRAPQLADPFIITPRNKEVRVDITMFNGSNVYGQVVDNKGKGVAQAQVVCIPSYGQLLAPMESAQAMREEHTDEQGYFELQELPAGNYQVMAQKEGYKYALNGKPLYANGYHEVKNFRVVLEPVESGEYSVYGTVYLSNGQAAADALVTLGGLGTENLVGVDREQQTDSGGKFLFEGVEIGTYVLTAELPGYSKRTLSRVLLDKENEIILEAAALVRGRVLAESTNQAPENGYTVAALQLEGAEEETGHNLFSLLNEAEEGERIQKYDDPEGRYEITLAAGTWQLEGSAAPLAPARKQITLLPGEIVEDIDLVLSADGSVIEGYVRTTDGQSPQGATVSLIEAGSASQALTMFAQDGAGLQTTQVADDGAFRFERLPEGTYFVVARHPSYPQAMSPSILLEAQDEATGIEILMGPGGALEGFVYEQGRPAQGWLVTVIANGQPYTSSTDRNGAYEIRNIPEGKFQAFAANPSLGLNPDALAGQGYPVTIWSGSVTYQNFGEFEGITVHVTVIRPAGNPLVPGLDNFAARVVLNPAAMLPVIGSGIDAGAIPGDHYTMAGQSVSIPDVAVGGWRVDYYELERTGTYRWRAYQDFEVTGEASELNVDLYVN